MPDATIARLFRLDRGGLAMLRYHNMPANPVQVLPRDWTQNIVSMGGNAEWGADGVSAQAIKRKGWRTPSIFLDQLHTHAMPCSTSRLVVFFT
ncbi:Uncharacterized protein HZ326_2317 [Fusarium oxysporum f. sp. albedinis]|nr:Uncharacterized protein HZ326_2317 [Fusarium oxysporum f. sp. albedinis]